MRNFFTRYSYSMITMFVRQFAIGLLGAVLALATSMNTALSIVSGVFSILFYLFLIYTMTWEIGAKDRISSDHGKLPARPWRGFVISLIANTPNFVIALIYTVFRLVSPDNDNVAAIMRTVAFFFEGMYQGILSKITIGELKMFEFWWSYFIIIIPAVLTAGLAYWLGTKNVHFTRMMETQYPESDREPKKKWFGKNKSDK